MPPLSPLAHEARGDPEGRNLNYLNYFLFIFFLSWDSDFHLDIHYLNYLLVKWFG